MELAVGYLIAWAVNMARKVGKRLEGEADQVIDTGLDRLHDVVAGKIGTDPALTDLTDEATADGEVSDLTRQRVDLAIRAAAAKDPTFGEAIARAVKELAAAGVVPAGGVSAIGGGAAAVGGNADIRADGGSAAALTMGDVTLGPAPLDPPRPGRSRD